VKIRQKLAGDFSSWVKISKIEVLVALSKTSIFSDFKGLFPNLRSFESIVYLPAAGKKLFENIFIVLSG
jgi:hypothetical protein